MIELELGELMIVPVKPKVWYLIDCRSPLSILGPDELQGDVDAALKSVATVERLKKDFAALYVDHQPEIDARIDDLAKSVANDVASRVTTSVISGAVIGGILLLIPERSAEVLREIHSAVRELSTTSNAKRSATLRF